ncbi:hypothetical protein HPSH417_07735 [Helicobacter pylori Shi417]|nr:hypothetical protein HPSH417_07735 [Helicobacter pylori Shi417]
MTRGIFILKNKLCGYYNEIFDFGYNVTMSMNNKDNDEVNIIQEYKKIYDECEVQDKIKVLGNIQKYQMDMLKFYP